MNGNVLNPFCWLFSLYSLLAAAACCCRWVLAAVQAATCVPFGMYEFKVDIVASVFGHNFSPARLKK